MRIHPRFLALLLLAFTVPSAGAVDGVFQGRVPCIDTEGVRVCAGDVSRRVESWDGIPPDAKAKLKP